MKKIFIILLLLSFLPSCWTLKTNDFSVAEVSQVSVDTSKTSVIKKEVLPEKIVEKIPVSSTEESNTTDIKINKITVDWKESELVNLQDISLVKKYINDWYDYIKLQDWFTSTQILSETEDKIKQIKNWTFPSIVSLQDYKEYDKVFFEKINKKIYDDISNLRTFIVKKEDIHLDTLTSRIIEEEYVDQNFNIKKRKKVESYYSTKYNNKEYLIKKDKLDKFINNQAVVYYYLNKDDSNFVYPVTKLWFSGYYVLRILEDLSFDKKTGILQYFPSVNSLLGINGIDDSHTFIEHKEILKPYFNNILKDL